MGVRHPIKLVLVVGPKTGLGPVDACSLIHESGLLTVTAEGSHHDQCRSADSLRCCAFAALPALPSVPLACGDGMDRCCSRTLGVSHQFGARRLDDHQAEATRRRCYLEARPFEVGSRRLGFCTEGNAALAFASGRAKTSTLAGFAATEISSPVAGSRPLRRLWVGLPRTVR